MGWAGNVRFGIAESLDSAHRTLELLPSTSGLARLGARGLVSLYEGWVGGCLQANHTFGKAGGGHLGKFGIEGKKGVTGPTSFLLLIHDPYFNF